MYIFLLRFRMNKKAKVSSLPPSAFKPPLIRPPAFRTVHAVPPPFIPSSAMGTQSIRQPAPLARPHRLTLHGRRRAHQQRHTPASANQLEIVSTETFVTVNTRITSRFFWFIPTFGLRSSASLDDNSKKK